MLDKMLRTIFTLIGGMLAYQAALLMLDVEAFVGMSHTVGTGALFLLTLLGGGLGFTLAPGVIERILGSVSWLEKSLETIPGQDILAGSLGLITGLIIAILLSQTFVLIPVIGDSLVVLINLLFGYFGMHVAIRKKEELFNIFNMVPRSVERVVRKKQEGVLSTNNKILDTSVIIDGRIADICESGFLEGVLIVPEFVLEELRHIADSQDVLKRNRGRRGLDILNKMQKELAVDVEIIEEDFEDLSEVDSKLVRLAKLLEAKVLTNDYNLNKVAELQGVTVLNINELANAVKPVVLPGEEMDVEVIKDGKEAGQGVGYLDDGTMIVVDNGKKHIGDKIEVLVTSILQTAAGRMIFAKPKAEADEAEQQAL